MGAFKMSENTRDATLKRYTNAKCAEDCMDKTRAPKNLGRTCSSLKKSAPGIRKITAKYNVEAEREGRPKISKSWVANLLESRQVENTQQNVSRKHHRRSFPGVEFHADTAAHYMHKGKQVAFLDRVDISKSSIILRSDNGGSFIDARVTMFCKDNTINWIPNNEGQPWEGCYGERSIGTLKNEYIYDIYAVCIFLMIVIEKWFWSKAPMIIIHIDRICPLMAVLLYVIGGSYSDGMTTNTYGKKRTKA